MIELYLHLRNVANRMPQRLGLGEPLGAFVSAGMVGSKLGQDCVRSESHRADHACVACQPKGRPRRLTKHGSAAVLSRDFCANIHKFAETVRIGREFGGMTEPIHFSELERLLADDNTPDEEIAPYLKPAQLRALPLAPIVTVDETKVELPRNRGIIGLSVKSLNDRANRKRLAAYEAKIRDGWKGLKLLAEGNSWFLYPILLKDIVDNLSSDHAVYSVAAAGDTLENMLRGTAQLEAKIKEHQFNGMLLSAGGNDIAGDLLRSYLTINKLPPKPASNYLNDQFDAFISRTREKLDGLFGGLTSRFPDLKIFCHGYDWPFPRKMGLWLEPAMVAQGVPEAVQPAVLKFMIDRYYEMLGSLAETYRDRVFVADCRGSVGAIMEWFDELHPFNPGYTRAADRFRVAINQVFGISRSVRAPATGAIISWYPREGAKGVTGSAEFDLGSVVTVGRKSDLDIVIDDERVSRNHVRLEIRQGNVVFTDLNTTNGTLLDGRRRIGATVWKPGEKLRIGDHVLEVEFASSRPAVSTISPSAACRLLPAGGHRRKGRGDRRRSIDVAGNLGRWARQAGDHERKRGRPAAPRDSAQLWQHRRRTCSRLRRGRVRAHQSHRQAWRRGRDRRKVGRHAVHHGSGAECSRAGWARSPWFQCRTTAPSRG